MRMMMIMMMMIANRIVLGIFVCVLSPLMRRRFCQKYRSLQKEAIQRTYIYISSPTGRSIVGTRLSGLSSRQQVMLVGCRIL
jgi:hypothetical protein